ncbi:MAG: phosphonate C-P lyase system protein PhnH [Paracoccaceae bacterium]
MRKGGCDPGRFLHHGAGRIDDRRATCRGSVRRLPRCPVRARAFRAALTVLARPGRIETIRGGSAPLPVSPAAATLLLTLCDGETPLHLAGDHDAPEVRALIAFHRRADRRARSGDVRARTLGGAGTP